MLAGEQVVLRPVRDDDLPTMYRIFSDLDTWAALQPETAAAVVV